ncbi:MAG: glycosyltransferase [Mucilaginibacter sp.]|nr:glycosyltransferase [Mucilaginibacter sp.]
MSYKNIVIVSQSHLCRNPRVLKESLALFRAGYSVTVLTAIYSNDLLQEDMLLIRDTTIQYDFYSDLRSFSPSAFSDRCVRKLFMLAQRYFLFESKFSLGYGVKKLSRICETYRAGLYIMHQELATVIGSEMVNKYQVIFDFEDWYSEDLLSGARKSRPLGLLKKAERKALQHGALSITTSNAMAHALAAFYKTDNCPEVIYNSFSPAPANPNETDHRETIRLYWFSQTIGEGRGLEFFISAMGKSAGHWELYLRGNITSAYQTYLMQLVLPKDKLVILPPQKNNEILSSMSEYHIGLALEPNRPPNKDLTISNKFFHYLAAGLPIIASCTAGHTEIGAQHPEFIFMYGQNDEGHLVALLDGLVAKSAENGLSKLRETVLKVYRSLYAWEIDERKLIHIISKSFENTRNAAN